MSQQFFKNQYNRIYLDAFSQDIPDSLGIGIIQFIASNEETAVP
jgi:hypothetical protein